jgi:hypothetical protein
MHATSRGIGVALWAATAVAAFGIGWIASPPHEPPVPGDLAASLRSALAEGDAIERQGRTASLLEALGPDTVPAVAALYERMIPLISRSELAAFFAAWARFDPLGAIDYALAWQLPEEKERRQLGVSAAIRVWAHRDPLAARQAVEQIDADGPGAVRQVVPQALATGWASSPRGQEGLASFLADLPPLRSRVELIETAVRELVRGGGAEAALGWAEPVLRDEGYEPVFKRSVFEAAAGSAAQWDPERAAAWAVEHSGADYAEDAVGIVAKHWGRRDGAAAMAWLAEQPAGERRDQAAREAFGQWSRTDPRSAMAWLSAEEPTAVHDPALEFKAQRLAAAKPELALGFCERIQDGARQQGCLESTAKKWYAQDAVSAETWLQQSSLDEEARSRVRAIPKQERQKRQTPRGPRRPLVGPGPR